MTDKWNEHIYGDAFRYWTGINNPKISSAFAKGLTEDNPDLAVPWEYETMLRLADIPASPIRTKQHYDREAGILKSVCHECAGGNHDGCAGVKKHKSHCDCQHMARRKAS